VLINFQQIRSLALATTESDPIMRRLGSEESELTRAVGHGARIWPSFKPLMRSPVLPSYLNKGTASAVPHDTLQLKRALESA
jgi:hypothetical protein